MLKNLCIAFCIVFVFFAVSAWYVYSHRVILTQKAVNYVTESVVGSISAKKDEKNQTWFDALISSGSQEIKKAVTEAVVSKGLDSFAKYSSDKQKSEKNMQPGLATFADMLANGAGDNGSSNSEQTAAAFLAHLGKNIMQAPEQSTDVHDINSRDNKGRTLLMNVCRIEVSPKVIKMMLKYGADINAQDNNGRTALMYAAGLQKDVNVVSFLIENGADVKLRDNQGKTASDYAKKIDIQEYIEKLAK